MMMFRIWGALMRPFVAHPLFQRAGIWKPPNSPLAQRMQRLKAWLAHNEKKLIIGGAVLVVVGGLVFGFWVIFSLALFVPMMVIAAFLPVLFILLGNIYGLMCAIAVNATIVNEIRQGRYILLGLTNYGFEGVTWALCSLTLHGREHLRRIRHIARGIFLFIVSFLSVPLLYGITFSLVTEDGPMLGITANLLAALCVALIWGMEFINSANVGCLIGMTAPRYTRADSSSQNVVLSLFFIAQVGVYLTVALLMFLLLPFFIWLLGGWSYLLISILTLVLLSIIREILLSVLWTVFLIANQADVEMFDRITHVGISKGRVHQLLSRQLMSVITRRAL